MSSKWMGVISGTAVAAVLVGVGVFGVNTAIAAQVQVNAEKAMTAAAPAYQGAAVYSDTLATLNVRSMQAKAAWDVQQAKIATAKAAAAAAAKAAAAKAAAIAAQQAAEAAQAAQEAQQQAQVQDATQPVQSAPQAPAAPPASNGLPAGSPVPWIPSTDPQNTAGGSWDTSACASHNASGNPAVCD